MEKLATPGDLPAEVSLTIDGTTKRGIDAALGDLRKWHALSAACLDCSNRKAMDAATLTRRFGRDVLLGTVESRLRCTSCRGARVRLEIHSQRRD